MPETRKVVITPGEPAGIGPDLVVQLAQRDWPVELVICADGALLTDRAKRLGLPLSLLPYDPAQPPVPQRAGTLTGTERTILQYYMDGYTVKDIPELARISASTVKTHNRNLYRKLGVDSFDELKVYIELFASCGRSGELLNK